MLLAPIKIAAFHKIPRTVQACLLRAGIGKTSIEEQTRSLLEQFQYDPLRTCAVAVGNNSSQPKTVTLTAPPETGLNKLLAGLPVVEVENQTGQNIVKFKIPEKKLVVEVLPFKELFKPEFLEYQVGNDTPQIGIILTESTMPQRLIEVEIDEEVKEVKNLSKK